MVTHSNSSAFRFASTDDAARCYWYRDDGAKPPGASLQWLHFRFRSLGFITHSPASHFAIALRARLGIDPAGTPVSISGRGMTLGDTSHASPGHALANAPGYGGARGAQIESFWPGGNFLYRDAACVSQGIRDAIWYRIELSVDDARRIELRIEAEDELARREYASVIDRLEHPVLTQAGAFLIALGRGPDESGPWVAEFDDIHYGWR
jgi:hypothetical protein